MKATAASHRSSFNTIRCGVAAFAATGALVVSLMCAGVAFADDKKNPVRAGVLDAFNTIELKIQHHGENIMNEKNLEHQRRIDSAMEQQQLDRMNQEGQAEQAQATAQMPDIQSPEPVGETIEDDATPMAAAPTSNGGAKAADTGTGATPAPEPEKAAEPKQEKRKSTIYVLGDYVPYIQGGCGDTAPPDTTASTWFGDGGVNDGANTYFIGHNPGIFKNVMNLQVGDTVTVWDDKGNQRTYNVYDTLVLSKTSNFYDYESRIYPDGETITLQTCCGDDKTVRCVMAR